MDLKEWKGNVKDTKKKKNQRFSEGHVRLDEDWKGLQKVNI